MLSVEWVLCFHWLKMVPLPSTSGTSIRVIRLYITVIITLKSTWPGLYSPAIRCYRENAPANLWRWSGPDIYRDKSKIWIHCLYWYNLHLRIVYRDCRPSFIFCVFTNWSKYFWCRICTAQLRFGLPSLGLGNSFFRSRNGGVLSIHRVCNNLLSRPKLPGQTARCITRVFNGGSFVMGSSRRVHRSDCLSCHHAIRYFESHKIG